MTNKELKALALAATGVADMILAPDVVLGLIADMDRLSEDRERIRSQRMEYASKYEQAIEDCDQLKAECEGLRKDAERYRWLKTKHQNTDSDIGVYDGTQILRTNAEVYDLHLDISVDQLMSKETSNG